MAREKKVTFCNLSSENRNVGRRIAQEKSKETTYNTTASTHNRRIQKIKEAANGCWWVEAYIMGNLIYPKNTDGIDDE
jgi:hypothetical protein